MLPLYYCTGLFTVNITLSLLNETKHYFLQKEKGQFLLTVLTSTSKTFQITNQNDVFLLELKYRL